jgi:hypothetical protein
MKNKIIIFSLPIVNFIILSTGMTIGFLWKWEPNLSLEVLITFMILTIVSVAILYFVIKPKLEFESILLSRWTILCLSPLVPMLFYIFSTIGLYVLVKVFIEYIQENGI